MNQTLHIFRKDLRRQWPDLTLYLIILAIAGIVVSLVRDGRRHSNPVLPLLVGIMTMLIPVCWLILTARLVHEESLVGDRQFWITRPYRWQSLLMAKLLFVALGVMAPFAIMQCTTVAASGFNPLGLDLIPTLLRMAVGMWLPFLLVSVVTSTLGSAMFATIGTLIAWIISLTFVVSRDEPRTDAPYAFPVLSVIFTCVFASVLLYQYRRRDTPRARAALLCVVPLFSVIFLGYVRMGFPFLGTSLMHFAYPVDTAPEFHLVFDAAASHISGDANKKSVANTLEYITLPIHLIGLNAENRLAEVHAQYTLEMSGKKYTSPWRPVMLTSSRLSLVIPERLFHGSPMTPAHLHLTIAMTELGPADVQTSAVSDTFPIAGNGLCHRMDAPGNPALCSFAFDIPHPIRIDPIAPPGCNAGSLQSVPIATLGATTSLDPVHSQFIRFGGPQDCKVTSVRSTVYKPLKSFSTTLDIPTINLNSYIDQ
jgi:hypothetical protein